MARKSGGALRLVRPADRDRQTAQTPGLVREAAVDGKKVGARTLWAGHVTMDAGMTSGAHHHGDSESVIYMIRGSARFRFGDDLSQSIEAHPGDFVFVPPNAVHLEANLSATEGAEMIVVRDRQENIVVPVDVPR
jgi:uncharacterized RmlC-like cupin family protein